MTVPPRISLVTLGVSDVDRATAFYEALGWPLSSSSVPGVVSFFRTAGAVLAVFGHDELAADAAVPVTGATGSAEHGAGFRGVALAVNVASPEEVDAAIGAAVAAGGRVAKAAARAEWGGYSGYFADPDGHLWEVAHNPGWPLDDEGLPQLP